MLGLDTFWGKDLIEGIAGHAVLEEYHTRVLNKVGFYAEDAQKVFYNSFINFLDRMEDKIGRSTIKKVGLKISKLVLDVYAPNWHKWYGTVTAIEKVITGEFGGKLIGGHVDIETVPKEIIDFKFVKAQSRHRHHLKGKPNKKGFDLGMEMYKSMAKAKATAILPLVKNLKGKPRKKEITYTEHAGEYVAIDDPKWITHNKATRHAAELLVEDIVDDIETGRFRGPTDPVGTGLCCASYCSFFGTDACKFTKYMSRRQSLAGEL